MAVDGSSRLYRMLSEQQRSFVEFDSRHGCSSSGMSQFRIKVLVATCDRLVSYDRNLRGVVGFGMSSNDVLLIRGFNAYT